MEEWSLKIIRADNGYYLEGSTGQRIVIQRKENDERYEYESLLLEVQTYFNFKTQVIPTKT